MLHTQPQTSAHPAPFPDVTSLQYTGTLLRDAQVRNVVVNDGHTVPVLCLDVELDNALRTHLHVQQTYPAGCHDLCQAAAKNHRERSRVCITAPLDHVAITAKHVTHIQALPVPPKVAEPVADLFA